MPEPGEYGSADPHQNLLRRGSKWVAAEPAIGIVEVQRFDADGVYWKALKSDASGTARRSDFLRSFKPVRS